MRYKESGLRGSRLRRQAPIAIVVAPCDVEAFRINKGYTLFEDFRRVGRLLLSKWTVSYH